MNCQLSFMDKYYLYIVECSDKTFYTGIARDLERRLEEHNHSSLGAKYTRGRRPVKLVYSKEFSGRSAATKEESCIKKLSRPGKLSLINKNK